ncbi:hypothetical protein OEZ86_011897 [Tetradesmus obliquus]|nr:hypothetical protein OEZ86_011897 [Tetradesmus obliquus]
MSMACTLLSPSNGLYVTSVPLANPQSNSLWSVLSFFSGLMLRKALHSAVPARFPAVAFNGASPDGCKVQRLVAWLAAAAEVVHSSSAEHCLVRLTEYGLHEAGEALAAVQSKRAVNQAVAAIQAAWKAGIKRQRIELLLPLIGATDLDDWPGGIRQQFKAAAPLVEGILKQLKQKEGLQGPLGVDIWDQGDAVGAWSGDNLAGVLFPTADTIKQLRQLAERSPEAPELLLIFNPQWELQGNLVSDFGFGNRKAASLALVESFTPTYWLKQMRVAGDDLRVLHAHPNKWQVHTVSRSGSEAFLTAFDGQPSYAQLQEALKAWPDAASNKSLMDRLRDEVQFIQDTAQPKQ